MHGKELLMTGIVENQRIEEKNYTVTSIVMESTQILVHLAIPGSTLSSD